MELFTIVLIAVYFASNSSAEFISPDNVPQMPGSEFVTLNSNILNNNFGTLRTDILNLARLIQHLKNSNSKDNAICEKILNHVYMQSTFLKSLSLKLTEVVNYFANNAQPSFLNGYSDQRKNSPEDMSSPDALIKKRLFRSIAPYNDAVLRRRLSLVRSWPNLDNSLAGDRDNIPQVPEYVKPSSTKTEENLQPDLNAMDPENEPENNPENENRLGDQDECKIY